MELISREDAIKCLEMFLDKQCDRERTKERGFSDNDIWASVNMAYDALTAEKVGKWIEHKDRTCWYCSECTTDDYYAYTWDCDTKRTMSDLISRQAALEAIEELKNRYFDRKVVLAKAQDAVNNMPTIDPVKHGRWVMQGTAYGCSLCGEGVIHPFHNYCPNCGARMDEVTE